MTVTAIAHEAVALSKLMQMVSECDEFQVATGTTAPAGALDFIFAPEKRNETEDQQEEQSPAVFAVVTFPDGVSATEMVAGGGKNWFTLSGRAQLQVIRQMGDGAKHDEMIEAMNLFGAIRTHCLNYAAVSDYLAITEFNWTQLLASNESEVAGYRVQKPIHKAIFDVAWGPGA
jgi:hypothetical protein